MDNGQRTIQRIACESRRFLVWLVLSIVSCGLSVVSCSIPKIESADCSVTREATKRYYSLAIGGDLAHQPDAMAQVRGMLTPKFTASGVKAADGRDPYNFSLTQPSSSRVDECTDLGPGKVQTDVTVIWRVNDENYLRKDKVTLIKYGDTWLIERIDVGQAPGPNF